MKSIQYMLDEAGEPVATTDLMTWAMWMESPAARQSRQVKREWVGDSEVATDFMGLDYNFLGSGPPILWETMVFSNHKDLQYSMDRCSGGREQAEAMHARMVHMVQIVDRVKNGRIEDAAAMVTDDILELADEIINDRNESDEED